MTKKIACKNSEANQASTLRIKVLKAPFVDSGELKRIVSARAKALILQF